MFKQTAASIIKIWFLIMQQFRRVKKCKSFIKKLEFIAPISLATNGLVEQNILTLKQKRLAATTNQKLSTRRKIREIFIE